MALNLNSFLIAVSNALDFVEMDILGVTSNHSKRVAYISISIAKEIGLNPKECFDIVALSILHDNGVSEKVLHNKLLSSDNNKLIELEEFNEHCVIGESNVKNFPFLTDVENVIKYHHEHFDGTGFFGIKGSYIPVMAQIISFSDTIDRIFNLKEKYEEKEEELLQYLREEENKLVSSKILNAFYSLNDRGIFKSDLKDEFLDEALLRSIPSFTKELSYKDIKDITKVFSKIIDCKSRFTAKHSSGLSNKVYEMACYYNKSEEEKIKLVIAANLHDIGKLAVPNNILDKPCKLSEEEFCIVKNHPYYTRVCLESINEFKDIAQWASNHHEKLNGKGYPNGLLEENLDFNSRLLACLDIYQALAEERPYRKPLPHEECMKILYEMVSDNFIDANITKDIDFVFSSN